MCLTIDFSSSPRSLPDINAYTMSFLFCIKYAVYARNYFHQRFTICKNKQQTEICIFISTGKFFMNIQYFQFNLNVHVQVEICKFT